MSIARRKIALDKAAAGGAPWVDEWLNKRWPSVHEWITSAVYEDGSSRTPGKIAFKLQDGSLCGTISDEDAKASCYVQGDTLQEVLDAMERALKASDARWVVWPSERARKRAR